MQAVKKLLKVALVGAPNAGKSTLLNKLIYSEVSCVSNKVHTTRKNFLAAYTRDDTQLEFFDSPGIVAREHLLRHRLEDSLLEGPGEAAHRCDLIAVVIDASNPREIRRLNKGILKLLQCNQDKSSFLIMNKVDLVDEKRHLLDIGTLLSLGCLDNKKVIDEYKLRSLMGRVKETRVKPSSRFVIELDKQTEEAVVHEKSYDIGFRGFSKIFSISALKDDGIDDLRETMLGMAKAVEQWPHGQDFVCSNNPREIVQSIIRGKVMDNTDKQVPYVVRYIFRNYSYDEYGSLHIDLTLKVPNKYMIGKLLGEHGVIIFRIINESRDKISTVLGCDVKLSIEVSASNK